MNPHDDDSAGERIEREIELLEDRARRLRAELLQVRRALRDRRLQLDLERRIGDVVRFAAIGGEPSPEAIILDGLRGVIVATDGDVVTVDFGDVGEYEVRPSDLEL